MRDEEKKALVSQLARGEVPREVGRARLRISAGIVHVLYSSLKSAKQYKFGINESALSADFELWICGSRDQWYLIPMGVIRRLHQHPDSYRDTYQPGLARIFVNTETNEVTYARGGIKENIRRYFQATFGDVI